MKGKQNNSTGNQVTDIVVSTERRSSWSQIVDTAIKTAREKISDARTTQDPPLKRPDDPIKRH